MMSFARKIICFTKTIVLLFFTTVFFFFYRAYPTKAIISCPSRGFISFSVSHENRPDIRVIDGETKESPGFAHHNHEDHTLRLSQNAIEPYDFEPSADGSCFAIKSADNTYLQVDASVITNTTSQELIFKKKTDMPSLYWSILPGRLNLDGSIATIRLKHLQTRKFLYYHRSINVMLPGTRSEYLEPQPGDKKRFYLDKRNEKLDAIEELKIIKAEK